MELTYDWHAFQSFFFPRQRTSLSTSQPTGPVYAVIDGGVLVSVYADGDDLSGWIGASVEDVSKGLSHRKLLFLGREQADAMIDGSLALSHSYDQLGHLRSECATKLGLHVAPHFLLEAIHGWWGKVLPSAFGVFIRLEGQVSHAQPSSLVVVFRRGRVESFQEPDFSALGLERARQPADVVKYLSEKHLVPVQGIFVSASEWREWSESDLPWRQVALSVRANRARMVPFRWSLAALMATRAHFGV